VFEQLIDADHLSGVLGETQQQPHGTRLDAHRFDLA
jgi:hypothetical protein